MPVGPKDGGGTEIRAGFIEQGQRLRAQRRRRPPRRPFAPPSAGRGAPQAPGLAPFPPGAVAKSVPVTVSPGSGRRSVVAIRSMLMDPIMVIMAVSPALGPCMGPVCKSVLGSLCQVPGAAGERGLGVSRPRQRTLSFSVEERRLEFWPAVRGREFFHPRAGRGPPVWHHRPIGRIPAPRCLAPRLAELVRGREDQLDILCAIINREMRLAACGVRVRSSRDRSSHQPEHFALDQMRLLAHAGIFQKRLDHPGLDSINSDGRDDQIPQPRAESLRLVARSPRILMDLGQKIDSDGTNRNAVSWVSPAIRYLSAMSRGCAARYLAGTGCLRRKCGLFAGPGAFGVAHGVPGFERELGVNDKVRSAIGQTLSDPCKAGRSAVGKRRLEAERPERQPVAD